MPPMEPSLGSNSSIPLSAPPVQAVGMKPYPRRIAEAVAALPALLSRERWKDFALTIVAAFITQIPIGCYLIFYQNKSDVRYTCSETDSGCEIVIVNRGAVP